MEARFAGSQRVGDRRRRRLAAGADDSAENPSAEDPIRPVELSAPASNYRAADRAHTEDLPTGLVTSLNLPLAGLVPAEGWKYVAGGVLGLAIGAGIVMAGYFAPRFQAITGTGLSDLFALPNSRLAQWFSSLLLLMSAQLALLIWWARSRSLEDYDGSYWLWIRTAGFWLVFSGCVSIEAHHVAVATLMKTRPGLSVQYANLCWMIPALGLAALLVKALVREMSGCRASRALLLLACACHLTAAGLHLEFETMLSAVPRGVLVQASLLTAYVALFVSMWLHARHVLHFSADPAPRSKRNWRIPRPHFRMSHWPLSQLQHLRGWRNRRQTLDSQIAPEEPKSRRKRPAREDAPETANQSQAESVPSRPAAPPAERTTKPRFRFDSRHLEASKQAVSESSLPPDQIDKRGESDSRDDQTPTTGSSPQGGSAEPEVLASEGRADPPHGEVGGTEPDDNSDEGPSKPELRGLSKKQRRRLMQEMRDRERDSKR